MKALALLDGEEVGRRQVIRARAAWKRSHAEPFFALRGADDPPCLPDQWVASRERAFGSWHRVSSATPEGEHRQPC